MAAFFFSKNECNNYIDIAEKVFGKRGFHNGRRYKYSCGEILIYSKQLIDTDNVIIKDGVSLFCIGSVIYKGLSYTETLNALLSDFNGDVIDFNEIFGEFVVIFIKDDKPYILTDESRMYKLFSDKENRFITSSFMAAAACTDCTINDTALTEQILYGFISAPDTLVNEVFEIKYDDLRNKINWINWIENKSTLKIKKAKNKAESVSNQTELIKKYMRSVSSLVNQYGAECGMSGGCDSRLIYTSASEDCKKLNSVHTHKTSDIHDKEIGVVSDITKLYSTPLVVIPTTFILDCSAEEIDKTLKENVLYFDARNSETIGSFSQTHTRWYKEKTANGNGVTFAGIGGEIYRDFYYTKGVFLSLKKWLDARVFIPFSTYIIPKDEYKRSTDRIAEKVLNATGIHKSLIYSSSFAKRYFDRYRIQNSLSNVVHTNNQMSFYLAPFVESKLIKCAESDGKWQDHCGEYEGMIISAFNKKAPCMMTSKGYSLSDIPFKTKKKWEIRGIVPSGMWISKKNSAHIDTETRDKLKKALDGTKYFKNAFNEFKKRYKNWNFEPVLNGRIPLNSFMFTVCAFYEITELKKGL